VGTVGSHTQWGWEKVADALRDAINSGELQPGDTLPAEPDLASQHGVSRDTVRRALTRLTQEGLITEGRARSGRQVRSYRKLTWHLSLYESRRHHEAEAAPGTDQFDADVIAQGLEPGEEIEVQIVDPPRRVAALLRVQPGELVVVRRRVRSVGGIPFQLADSYFREPLIRGTPLMEPRKAAAPGGVLAQIGHPQARYQDKITVRMPTHDEADRLSLPAVTPVAEIVRTGYDEDGTPLRVMVTIAPGDRHEFVYEMDAT
jgi:DNA-binding GntR family transcriptional regulator